MVDLKVTVLTALGLLGSCIADLFGGWDAELQSLVIFMAIDYATGLVLAGAFAKAARQRKASWKAGPPGRAWFVKEPPWGWC